MIKNPFKFGTIVDSRFFTNRKSESKQLKSMIHSDVHIIMISPRRFGKSSLIHKILSGIKRPVISSNKSVLNGEWDYERFIGRQMDGLTIGVIGYGRLGAMYSSYCIAMGAKVLVYDPYKKVKQNNIERVHNINLLLAESDIISFHLHVSEETKNMVNQDWFNKMKKDVLLVNTSRGDIIVENNLVEFLKENNQAKIATDVLADEIRNRMDSPLLKYAINSEQVTITPHIGGMTREAQEIAYNHAAIMLYKYFKED